MSQPNNNVVGVVKEDNSGVLQPIVSYNLPVYDESLISPTRTATQIGRLAGRKSVPAKTHLSAFAGTASFNTDFRGSGVATTQPAIKDLLTTGGFAYTGADAANTYLLDGTNPCDTLSYTITAYGCGDAPKGDTQHLVGAVPALTISAEAVGAPVVLGVELTGGHIEATSDEATLFANSNEDTTDCLHFIGGVYTLGGVGVDLQGFSLPVAPVVVPRMDATNTVTNIAQHAITDLSARTLTFSYIKPLLDTKDYSTEFKAETIYDTMVLQFVSASGDTGSITLTDVQVTEWGDEKGDVAIFTNATLTYNTATIALDY